MTFLAFASQAQDVETGRELYAQFCATCHGADLRGGIGSNLVDAEWAFGGSRVEIARTIHNGIPERGMPPFGNALEEDQINAVIDFIERAAQDPSVVSDLVPDSLVSLDYGLRAEIFAQGIVTPWAIEFLDDHTALITEKTGGLRVVENGRLHPEPVRGTPEVVSESQGGLLDVTKDPAYAENGWIYLSYSHLHPQPIDGKSVAMTRIVRGRIRDNRWVDERVVYEAPHETYLPTRHHYGNRIVFDEDGYLYFSIGDRGVKEMAQDLGRPNGKIHRIFPDGSIPPDNPFFHVPGALPTIYSYGHRNPQGLAVHPETGEIWDLEHGPRGGDELNRAVAGRNYGWPIISYGINYDQTVMTEHRRWPGMEQPVFYWRPSLGISGLSFYTGDLFADWKGRMLAGALAYKEVRLLHLEDGRVMHQEVILKDAGRVREAVQGPDGAVYVVLNEPDMVLRLTPGERRWR